MLSQTGFSTSLGSIPEMVPLLHPVFFITLPLAPVFEKLSGMVMEVPGVTVLLIAGLPFSCQTELSVGAGQYREEVLPSAVRV